MGFASIKYYGGATFDKNVKNAFELRRRNMKISKEKLDLATQVSAGNKEKTALHTVKNADKASIRVNENDEDSLLKNSDSIDFDDVEMEKFKSRVFDEGEHKKKKTMAFHTKKLSS